MTRQSINIGDEVIVAVNNNQTYRPDLIKVVVRDITKTPVYTTTKGSFT